MPRTTSGNDLKHSTARKRKKTMQRKKSTHTLHVQQTQGTFGLYLRQLPMLLLGNISEKQACIETMEYAMRPGSISFFYACIAMIVMPFCFHYSHVCNLLFLTCTRCTQCAYSILLLYKNCFDNYPLLVYIIHTYTKTWCKIKFEFIVLQIINSRCYYKTG